MIDGESYDADVQLVHADLARATLHVARTIEDANAREAALAALRQLARDTKEAILAYYEMGEQ